MFYYKNKIKSVFPDYNKKLDNDRGYQEIAIIMEKKDINEEIIRLNGHITLLKQIITEGDSVGKKISVSKMRDRLSKDFTKEMYENWKGFYDMFVTELEAQNEQLENLKKIHDGMRVRAAQVKTSDRTEYKKIVQQAKDIATNFSKIKKQRETTEGYLNEFKYMKQVKSFEEMKQFIKTCDFWAETWALSTLETIFNTVS